MQVRTETETGQISVIHWPNIESEAGKLKQKPNLRAWGEAVREMNSWEMAEIQNPKSNGTQQYNATN